MQPTDLDRVAPQGWERVTYAEEQPEYLSLPALRSRDGRVVTRWQPTPEERAQIAAGADVYLTVYTCNAPLQPLMLTVDGAPLEPIPLVKES